MLDSGNVGTTACVAFITIECRQRVLYVANVGDTRAVLVDTENATRISYDHRTEDEAEIERIKYCYTLI